MARNGIPHSSMKMLLPAGREVLVQKPSAWASQKAKKPVHATDVSERESLVYRNARYQPGTGKPIVYNRTSAVPGLQVSDNGVYQDLARFVFVDVTLRGT